MGNFRSASGKHRISLSPQCDMEVPKAQTNSLAPIFSVEGTSATRSVRYMLSALAAVEVEETQAELPHLGPPSMIQLDLLPLNMFSG